MTLEERVREIVGAGGPEHESIEEYNRYIDGVIDRMSNLDLLYFISIAMERDNE